jgi:ketosteroid isomerase-like protein
MTSTQESDIKANIEATVNSYLATFIDAKAQNDPSLVNRNTTPDCTRQMLPTSLSGGGSMNNEDYQKVFTQGMNFAGMKKNTASDMVIDVDARKAAVTAVAELESAGGEKFNLDFAWFLHLNDDGSKIKKIVEFVDSDTFKAMQQKAPAPSE